MRAVLLVAIVGPILKLGYRVDVRGREHLAGKHPPALIVANHTLHLDWGFLLLAMPGRTRRRVMVAAAASDIFGSRTRGMSASLVGNAFPFAKEGSGVRESLEFASAMLSQGWSILLLPEGARMEDGPMLPFKRGIGWLAVRTGADIIPMRIDVVRPGVLDGGSWWRPRGHVRVSIGERIRSGGASGYVEITDAIERAVRGA